MAISIFLSFKFNIKLGQISESTKKELTMFVVFALNPVVLGIGVVAGATYMITKKRK